MKSLGTESLPSAKDWVMPPELKLTAPSLEQPEITLVVATSSG